MLLDTIRTDYDFSSCSDEHAVESLHVNENLGISLPMLGGGDIPSSTFIRLANTENHRNSASVLINRRYAWRGYGSQHRIISASTHMTFVASVGNETVGTITLGVDSPSGLAADAIFRDEINTFRRVPGAKVCELTKLAFDSASPAKPLLAALFHIVFIYGQRHYDCTDLFIEVNPRHVRFYETMLGFKRIGNVKTNESVSAPAQLMWLKVSDIRAQIDEHAGQTKGPSSRSLYPFFFSKREENGIYARLTGAQADRSSAKHGGYVRHDPPHTPNIQLSDIAPAREVQN